MKPENVTTAFELPNKKIIRNVGIVRGIVVRSRSIIGRMLGGFQMIMGGNITIYTNMCEKARIDAYNLMCAHAERHGANAVIAMHYDTTEIMPGTTEVLCYGTAVVVEEA